MIEGLDRTRHPIPHESGEWMEIRDKISLHMATVAADAKGQSQLAIVGGLRAKVGDAGLFSIAQMLNAGKRPSEIADAMNADEANGDTPADAPPAAPAEKRPETPSEPPGPERDPKPGPTPAAQTGEGADGFRRHFDLDVLANEIVTDWSYGPSVALEHIQNLDPRTRDWIHGIALARLEAFYAGGPPGN